MDTADNDTTTSGVVRATERGCRKRGLTLNAYIINILWNGAAGGY